MTGSARVVVRRSPAELARDPRATRTAVVIDVLRATSTAATLLARGLERIEVVATPRDLQQLPVSRDPRVVISEMAELRTELGHLDNSPVLVRSAELSGKCLVLVTTNGTRTLMQAAQRAERVFLASFLNLSAVARHVAADPGDDEIWIIAAGNVQRDEDRTEDSECADALVALLRNEPPRLAERLARCRSDAKVQRRLAGEGPAFAADLELCLSCDLYDVVPGFHADGSSRGHIVRAA